MDEPRTPPSSSFRYSVAIKDAGTDPDVGHWSYPATAGRTSRPLPMWVLRRYQPSSHRDRALDLGESSPLPGSVWSRKGSHPRDAVGRVDTTASTRVPGWPVNNKGWPVFNGITQLSVDGPTTLRVRNGQSDAEVKVVKLI